jgi:hypothetical protein
MLSESHGLRTATIVRNCKQVEITTGRKLDLFPSSGERRETSTLLSPLERANLNRQLFLRDPTVFVSPSPHLKQIQFTKKIPFLLFRIPDDTKVQAPSDCFTPSSEPFRFYTSILVVLSPISPQRTSHNLT